MTSMECRRTPNTVNSAMGHAETATAPTDISFPNERFGGELILIRECRLVQWWWMANVWWKSGDEVKISLKERDNQLSTSLKNRHYQPEVIT